MEIMTWLLGSLEDRSFDHLWIALPCIATGAVLLLWDGRALDALTLGEDGARSLGMRLDMVRLRLLLGVRSEEHTSELQSLMRISYAVFCLKKKNNNTHKTQNTRSSS